MTSLESQITFLYTDDLAASVHFYETLLGFTLWLDQGTCRIYHVVGTAYLGLCQSGAGEAQHTRPPQASAQPNVIFTLVTDDVDGWYARLSALGVVFEKAPAVNARYRIYNCFLRDPNGYLLEIQRFLA